MITEIECLNIGGHCWNRYRNDSWGRIEARECVHCGRHERTEDTIKWQVVRSGKQ